MMNIYSHRSAYLVLHSILTHSSVFRTCKWLSVRPHLPAWLAAQHKLFRVCNFRQEVDHIGLSLLDLELNLLADLALGRLRRLAIHVSSELVKDDLVL